MRKNILIPTLQGILVTALFLATEVILQKLGAFNGPIRRYAVDILLRFLFGLIALFLIWRCYRKDRSEYKLGEYFTNEIPRTIWFYLIPFIAYLLVQFSFILFANKTNTVVAGMFALDCLQQFGSGFFEEACRVLIICGLLKYCINTKKGRICTVLVAGAIFGLSHGLNFFFGQDISSTLWQVGSCFIWGSFMAAIFMISRNIALLMILHAVWDIVIRIPNTFFGFPEECLGLTVLDVGGYAVSYTAMLAVAFFIAINYDNYKMNSMRDFFKKHIVIAILTVFIAGFLINEGLYQMGEALHFSLGTSNMAFFITEIIRKVIPALLIAFCIGTLDSLKYPLKDFGKSLLSGAWILFLAVLGSVVNCVEAMDDGSKITSPSEIVFYILFMLMIGLAEELLMRGTITRLLAEKFGKEGKGMVISVMIGAVCFGLYHLSNYLGTYDLKATLHQVLATTLCGMLLCAIYVKWGNLLAVIILHAAFDFAALFEYGMIAGKSIADRHSRGAGDFKQILISNSTFVIAAVIVMVHKKKKKNIPVEESI